jgi:hypothetical protein
MLIIGLSIQNCVCRGDIERLPMWNFQRIEDRKFQWWENERATFQCDKMWEHLKATYVHNSKMFWRDATVW